MNFIDYFYEEYLLPVLYWIADISEMVIETALIAALYITSPIWIIPYFIIRKRRGE